jgi:hypothetical protein
MHIGRFGNNGHVHSANRASERAMTDYSAAIDIGPKFGVAFTNRCLTEAIIGRAPAAAAADCDMALELMPNNADVRMRQPHNLNHAKAARCLTR